LAAGVLAATGQPASAECASVQATPSCESEQGQAVTSVRGLVIPHHGGSYKRPGYSSLQVVSTPEAAYITASEPRTSVHSQWLTAERESNVITAKWDCRRPRQTFSYVLTARGEAGATVTARVTFHAQLSTRWCATAKRREEAQRLATTRRHEAEAREAELRKQRAVEHREAERHEAERGPAPSTCTNGTYVNSAGNTVCKPETSPSAPAGATAKCEDGTYSFSESRSGTCSSHGGVAEWL
jgi:hypothetical protein